MSDFVNIATGKSAAKFLQSRPDLVGPPRKDNTDKLWGYKVKGGANAEFAFDPNTVKGLYVWFDRVPPSINGVENIEDIRRKSTSTALKRVFSGRLHTAKYKATIRSIESLEELIRSLASADLDDITLS